MRKCTKTRRSTTPNTRNSRDNKYLVVFTKEEKINLFTSYLRQQIINIENKIKTFSNIRTVRFAKLVGEGLILVEHTGLEPVTPTLPV